MEGVFGTCKVMDLNYESICVVKHDENSASDRSAYLTNGRQRRRADYMSSSRTRCYLIRGGKSNKLVTDPLLSCLEHQ